MVEINRASRLTSAEISNLWNTYMNDSLNICMVTHFLQTVEDPDVKPLLEETINVAQAHLVEIETLFQQEGIPKPVGFPVEKHVKLNAPRLFTDVFYMAYLLHMSKFGMTAHAGGITLACRKDIHDLFHKYVEEAISLNGATREVMKEKGVFIRPPYMDYPKEVEFVTEQKFLTGWFGHKRSLLALETSHLYMTSLNNELGKDVLLGFSQVAKDVELKKHFIRGTKLTSDILYNTHGMLHESDIPASMTWDTCVTDSTVAPYSEQVMLCFVNALCALGVATYGSAMSLSIRHDLAALYSKFIMKSGAYAEDGANMLIERSWMEKPPQFIDRDKLIRKNTES
ncbi:hypothetical protein COJ70_24485 [Priestia megaterium]|uniref:DUF3231 family protein n=1 Tax=Priestia megaterium TaxID=1404 RepID=UPI000BFA8559|nr:DUF3231 family protein [Priestia megaterium]PFO12729.1 hypothetical protein COJ70_24485 [Priestia megaterium]